MRVQDIFEAISDEDTRNLQQMGVRIVDSVTVGDYTLYLCKSGFAIPGPRGEPITYQVALNKHDYSFTDPGSQLTKRDDAIDRSNISRARSGFLATVQDWKKKYGTLAAGSYNPQKTKIYHKILTRFGVSPSKPNSMHGFSYFFI